MRIEKKKQRFSGWCLKVLIEKRQTAIWSGESEGCAASQQQRVLMTRSIGKCKLLFSKSYCSIVPGYYRGLRNILYLLCTPSVRIFSDHIRDRIRLKRFRSVRIWVKIFNIRYRIRIWILKLHIYDVDIQSYPIRHGWHYPHSNLNLNKNMKTNVILVIPVRIRSVFIPSPRIDDVMGCVLVKLS
jgi:hypothetical protein